MIALYRASRAMSSPRLDHLGGPCILFFSSRERWEVPPTGSGPVRSADCESFEKVWGVWLAPCFPREKSLRKNS